MICPLCQYSFDEASACSRCGMVKGCAMIKCPRCGYEFVEHSKIVDFFRRVFSFFRKVPVRRKWS